MTLNVELTITKEHGWADIALTGGHERIAVSCSRLTNSEDPLRDLLEALRDLTQQVTGTRRISIYDERKEFVFKFRRAGEQVEVGVIRRGDPMIRDPRSHKARLRYKGPFTDVVREFVRAFEQLDRGAYQRNWGATYPEDLIDSLR